jgi:hypothetical protein
MKNIIDLFNIILCITIVAFLLFGSKKKCLEKFENTRKLTNVQQEILEGVQRGTMDNTTITQYIRDNKFNKKDLDTIISYLSNH